MDFIFVAISISVNAQIYLRQRAFSYLLTKLTVDINSSGSRDKKSSWGYVSRGLGPLAGNQPSMHDYTQSETSIDRKNLSSIIYILAALEVLPVFRRRLYNNAPIHNSVNFISSKESNCLLVAPTIVD